MVANLAWAESAVRRYGRLGVPREDLVAEAHVGLVEASHRYDGNGGASFRTYASWWIRKRVVDRIASDLFFVRLPRSRIEKLRAVRAAERELTSRLGRKPSTAEIAKAVRSRVEEVRSLLADATAPLSLEDPVSEPDGPRWVDRIPDRRDPSPAAAAMRADAWQTVSRLLCALPPRQQSAVRLHFGLAAARGETFAEIGRRLGVSRERARQLVRSGMARIREGLASNGPAS